MAVDVGTGSGQAVLRRARQNPDEMVIGIDADSRAMAESSRRAAAAHRRGGLPNAMFIVAAAEELPGPLAGIAHHVTVALPWGSLLRGLLAADPPLLEALSGLLANGGELEILVSATERDAAADGLSLASDAEMVQLAERYRSAGLQIAECRPAVEADVSRLSSGWGKRLGIPARRRAWLLRAKRARVRSPRESP